MKVDALQCTTAERKVRSQVSSLGRVYRTLRAPDRTGLFKCVSVAVFVEECLVSHQPVPGRRAYYRTYCAISVPSSINNFLAGLKSLAGPLTTSSYRECTYPMSRIVA